MHISPQNYIKKLSPLLLIQSSFLPASVASHLIRISLAWWMLSNDDWAELGLLVTVSAGAQIASRLLLGGLGDCFHPLKLNTLWLAGSCIASCVLAMLVHLDWPSDSLAIVWAACVLALCQGAREPLASTIAPKIASPATIAAFIPLRTSVNTFAQIGGPLLAGISVATLGITATLGLACTLITASALIAGFSIRTYDRLLHAHTSLEVAPIGSYLDIVKLPIKNLHGYLSVPSEREMAAVCFAINFLLPGFFSLLLPSLVQHENLSPIAVGIFDSAFGVGILVGSLFIVKRLVNMVGRVSTMTIGVMLCGTSIMITAAWPSLFSAIALCVGGVGLVMLNINIMTVRSIATPTSHIGGFSSAASFITALAIPLGNSATAAAVLRYGDGVVGVAAGLVITVCGCFICALPTWRAISRLSTNDLAGYYLKNFPTAFNRSPQ